jgi:hypothetical protein
MNFIRFELWIELNRLEINKGYCSTGPPLAGPFWPKSETGEQSSTAPGWQLRRPIQPSPAMRGEVAVARAAPVGGGLACGDTGIRGSLQWQLHGGARAERRGAGEVLLHGSWQPTSCSWRSSSLVCYSRKAPRGRGTAGEWCRRRGTRSGEKSWCRLRAHRRLPA